mmetsp:Transcript_39200/g.113285  ORF Transcript_39200/g.113285 Transcript_39200/m.113285 type:complete len:196 (+) Transcript_39200:77-664(+)
MAADGPVSFAAALRREAEQSRARDRRAWDARAAGLAELLLQGIRDACEEEARSGGSWVRVLLEDLLAGVAPDAAAVFADGGLAWMGKRQFTFGDAPGWVRGLHQHVAGDSSVRNSGSAFVLGVSDVADQLQPSLEAALQDDGLQVSASKVPNLQKSMLEGAQQLAFVISWADDDVARQAQPKKRGSRACPPPRSS